MYIIEVFGRNKGGRDEERGRERESERERERERERRGWGGGGQVREMETILHGILGYCIFVSGPSCFASCPQLVCCHYGGCLPTFPCYIFCYPLVTTVFLTHQLHRPIN